MKFFKLLYSSKLPLLEAYYNTPNRNSATAWKSSVSRNFKALWLWFQISILQEVNYFLRGSKGVICEEEDWSKNFEPNLELGFLPQRRSPS